MRRAERVILTNIAEIVLRPGSIWEAYSTTIEPCFSGTGRPVIAYTFLSPGSSLKWIVLRSVLRLVNLRIGRYADCPEYLCALLPGTEHCSFTDLSQRKFTYAYDEQLEPTGSMKTVHAPAPLTSFSTVHVHAPYLGFGDLCGTSQRGWKCRCFSKYA